MIMPLMGWTVVLSCGQCESKDVRYACAYHRIFLCEHCKHLECWHDCATVWEISDSMEPSSSSWFTYEAQTTTIALLQLLAPGQKYRQSFANIMIADDSRTTATSGSSSSSSSKVQPGVGKRQSKTSNVTSSSSSSRSSSSSVSDGTLVS